MGIAGDEKAIIEEYIDKQPDSDLAGVQIREKGPTGYEPASHEERALDKRIDRKFDFILLPIMSVNYALAGLDKNSLGNALTVTFIKDTGFDPNTVSNAVSMTAVSIVFAPFLISLGRRVGVSYYLATMTLGWGLCTIGSAYCKQQGAFYFIRILQAILETPVTQLSLYFISTLYPRSKYGLRMAIYTGFSVFGGGFGNLIAYGVFQITHLDLKNWQLLFILYGSLSCLFGVLVGSIVPDRLGTAWILTPAERAHAVERMSRDNDVFSKDKADGRNVGWPAIKFALTDWKKLIILCGQICIVMPVVGFLVFTPVLVGGMGYAGVKANLMSVTPFFAAYLGLLGFQKSSDHFRERSLHTVAALLLSIIGLAVMVGSSNNILRYVFLHICIGGAFAPGTTIAAWLADNTPDASIRVVLFGLLGLTPVSSVIAGQIYKPIYAPSFKTPLAISMGITVAAVIFFSSIRVLYMIENSKRRKLVANMTAEEIEAEKNNPARRGDQKITFIRAL
ncbi:hypothetical protein EMMF5_002288 [Cystobasidiomycetes sp. EMM_F5]